MKISTVIMKHNMLGRYEDALHSITYRMYNECSHSESKLGLVSVCIVADSMKE